MPHPDETCPRGAYEVISDDAAGDTSRAPVTPRGAHPYADTPTGPPAAVGASAQGRTPESTAASGSPRVEGVSVWRQVKPGSMRHARARKRERKDAGRGRVILTAVLAAACAGAVSAAATVALISGDVTGSLLPQVAGGTAAHQSGGNVVGAAASQVSRSVFTIVSVRDEGWQSTGRSGAAVAWSSDGLLVTNYHVVGDGGVVRLMGSDGDFLDAEVLGGDERADVAVLKVDRRLVAPTWTQSTPPVGSLAVAIGAPFGLGGSVSAGIVSATNRNVGVSSGAALSDVIQFDAAVNPGNSGGPLINANGQVFGLVTAIYSRSGTNEGVAFALPTRLVADVVSRIVEGSWTPGRLGVLAGDAPELSGAQVVSVEPGSGAEAAGMLSGDIIVRVGDAPVRTLSDVLAAVTRAGSGTQVTVEVLREGVPLTLNVTLGEDRKS